MAKNRDEIEAYQDLEHQLKHVAPGARGTNKK
jgi:hypothetical protein